MLPRFIALFAAATLTAFAHYTWLAPAAAFEPGKPATIRIGHGHLFPQSEEAINARQVELFAVAPSGAKIKLQPAQGASFVSATFTPTEPGAHRLALTQDRGIASRTPKGVKKGGRDQNPDASQSYRTFRTAVSYLGAASGKPIGLEIELAAERSAGAWHVQLRKNGQPAGGVEVEAFLAGAAHPTALGKTAADGKVHFTPPAGAKGPAIFTVAFKDPATGASYDFVNYESSLYVTW